MGGSASSPRFGNPDCLYVCASVPGEYEKAVLAAARNYENVFYAPVHEYNPAKIAEWKVRSAWWSAAVVSCVH
jgi:hypothetical protein